MPASRNRNTSATLTQDPRFAALAARDASADGQFVYSVRTTGVYCRPSCGARPARPENVAFHATTADAERAGFRPCKRCKPDQPPAAERSAALVTSMCRFIEAQAAPPTLEQLAAAVGLSPFHAHRAFKAQLGVTPHQYAAGQRAAQVRKALASAPTVTQAIYAAGFNSSGRFYEQASELLGMAPRHYKAGGAQQPIRFALGECTLGSILVAATERGVCAILLGDEPHALLRELEQRFPRAELIGADAAFETLVANVVGMLETPGPAARLPLDIQGTAFQQRVWKALAAIPAGRTLSYAQIAQAIGQPSASRAVARACAANPLAVAIPCHRVVRADGALGGYRWGIERKRELLTREGRS